MKYFKFAMDTVTAKDKIDYLQRKLLINSVAERQLDFHFMDDDFKNNLIQTLIDLQSVHPNEKQTRYGYVFEDFTIEDYDDLYLKLNDYDKEQIDKICRLYANSASHPMENYYILEEYIDRGDVY